MIKLSLVINSSSESEPKFAIYRPTYNFLTLYNRIPVVYLTNDILDISYNIIAEKTPKTQ